MDEMEEKAWYSRESRRMKIKDRTHIFYFSYFGGMKDTQEIQMQLEG